MKTYQYVNAENKVVAIIDEDGLSRSSCLASVLPLGAEIEPYVAPPITPADIVVGMEKLFDTKAQSKNYDNRITCALRAGYPGPFHDEGVAFASWMDAQNAKAYTMLAQVQAGTTPMPATVEDALALLDPIVWPA